MRKWLDVNGPASESTMGGRQSKKECRCASKIMLGGEGQIGYYEGTASLKLNQKTKTQEESSHKLNRRYTLYTIVIRKN